MPATKAYLLAGESRSVGSTYHSPLATGDRSLVQWDRETWNTELEGR